MNVKLWPEFLNFCKSQGWDGLPDIDDGIDRVTFEAFCAGSELKERENADLRKLAAIGIELASYANESLPTNQPEFLEGLFERIQAFADAHSAIVEQNGEVKP